MSEAVICDECGKVLKSDSAIHCHDALVSGRKFVYGADICKECHDKFDWRYEPPYGWHAEIKKESGVRS